VVVVLFRVVLDGDVDTRANKVSDDVVTYWLVV
jgi:hypothetical protein